jgi:hypothetical protein
VAAAAFAAALGAGWLSPADAPAADSTWTGPGGGVYSGTFHLPTNWSAGVPGPADAATFGLPQTYTVTLTADATNRAALFTAGAVTLKASPNNKVQTYTVGSAAVSGGATLTLQNSGFGIPVSNLKFVATGPAGMAVGPGGTLAVANADLDVDVLDVGAGVPATEPAQTSRATLTGGRLWARQIRVGNAGNGAGTAVAELRVRSETVGAPTARVNVLVDRGGWVEVGRDTRFHVGSSLRVAGGTFAHRDAYADDLTFAPNAVAEVSAGGTLTLDETTFTGASMTARDAGSTLTFTGIIGSAGGSLVHVTDGARLIEPGGHGIEVGGWAPGASGELRVSGGATAEYMAIRVGTAGGDGRMVVTGEGTVVAGPRPLLAGVTVGSAGPGAGTLVVSNGAKLEGVSVRVDPTGTFTLDRATFRGRVLATGGTFRVTNGASIANDYYEESIGVSGGGLAVLSSGTVPGKITAGSGGRVVVDGPVTLTSAYLHAGAGGTLTAAVPLSVLAVQLRGGTFTGDQPVTTNWGFEVSGATVTGSGDITVNGYFDSQGTNTARILGTRRVIVKGGGHWSGEHDIELGPDVVIRSVDQTIDAFSGVRLLGGRFDNVPGGGFSWAGTGVTSYTTMFNNDDYVLVRSTGNPGDDTGLSLDGGGTHHGRFELSPIGPRGGFYFGGGAHRFESASRVWANRLGFHGNVVATVLGEVAVTNRVSVSGMADVTVGRGARLNLATAALTVADAGVLRLNTGAPVAVGSLSVGGGRLETADDLTVAGAFDLAGGAVVVNRPTGGGTTRVIRAGGFTAPAAGGGRLDLTRNAMVVDYAPGGPSPLADVAAAVARGYRGGAWDGPGIVSSDAAADASRFAVGYAEAADVLEPGEAFLGRAVNASAVLVRFTLAGDATLDGRVDFDDLVRVAQEYDGPVGTGGGWSRGDFDYDGDVDFADLVRLAQNYDGALPPDGGSTPAGFGPEFARAMAAVPEPAGVAVIGLAAAVGSLLTRRRR